MCLAVPGKVLSIEGEDALSRTGKVAFSSAVKEASLALLPEAEIGDYILVHAGFAIALVDEAEAKRTLEDLRALGAVGAEGEPEA